MSRQTAARADDPYGGRQPTSHERLAGQPWDASYLDGPPPWDIGRPQPAIVRLAGEGYSPAWCSMQDAGRARTPFTSPPLGSAFWESMWLRRALSIAREKAAARGIRADFEVADALHLDRLGRVFETVLDCGLFHSFDSDERRITSRVWRR